MHPDPLIVTLDGDVFAASERPLIHAHDAGVLRADGVFDVVRAVDGVLSDLDRHLDRFCRSAEALELPAIDRDAFRRAIHLGLERWDWASAPEVTVRLVLTRGATLRNAETPGGVMTPSAWVAIEPLSESARRAREHGVRVLTLSLGVDPAQFEDVPWRVAGAKTLGYTDAMSALRYAANHQAEDVIFTTPDGVILEGATAAVLVERNGQLETPDHPGILRSTTVERLESALADHGRPLTRRALHRDELRASDGAWLVSSGRLLARVTHLDGAELPRGSADPLLRSLLFG